MSNKDYCAALEKRIAELELGLHAVRDLIADLKGVVVLHLNGDIALWNELRTGGRFEEWLKPFDDAISGTPNTKAEAKQ